MGHTSCFIKLLKTETEVAKQVLLVCRPGVEGVSVYLTLKNYRTPYRLPDGDKHNNKEVRNV